MHTIGRIDKVDFPELGLIDVEAKIDSGAYTSSIHCETIKAFYKGGDHFVKFIVFNEDHPVEREAKVFASKQVKNSFGQIEYRYTIKTPVILFEKTYLIELALTNRSSMKYPVLLGRKLLGERFIIDVTKRNLSFKEKMKKKKTVKWLNG
ncbi:MAG TPA: RimK/LysX family protein [Chitinophagales bacterium]|nr:RimK/LysX family protein [Chitinophagales bacterium]